MTETTSLAHDALGLTIMHAPGKSARKEFQYEHVQWRCTQDYDDIYTMQPIEFPFTELAALHDLLQKLAQTKSFFLIRGGLTQAARLRCEANPEALVNRCVRPQPDGRVPDLVEVDRSWVMMDIDDFRLPAGCTLDLTDADDHEAIANLCIATCLDAEFHDASYIYQFSNSCGLFSRNLIKVHLWFLLDRPARNACLRKLAQNSPRRVDHAPFNAAQPHYVAHPLLRGGHDPLPRRLGLVVRENDAVTLPSSPPKAAVEMPATAIGGTASTARDAFWLAGTLRSLGDGPGRSGFHVPLRDAIWQYCRYVANGQINRNDDRLANLLIRAANAAPRRDDRHDISRYTDPVRLKYEIETALLKAAMPPV